MRIAQCSSNECLDAAQTDRPVVSVSVVIPCYCCDDTIERALLSVIAQSVRPCQVILVDDGSPDGNATHDKLLELQTRFSHVQSIETVFLESRLGPGPARNAGWNRATGKYVAFLDADETWHPEKLAVQYDWMSTHKDLALCGAARVEVSSRDARCEDAAVIRHASLVSKRSLLVRNFLPTSTVMLRRDLDQRFVPEQMRSEDYLLWLEIVSSGQVAMKLDTVLAYCYKPPYGAAGLTGDLCAMERAELQVLKRVHERGYVGLLSWCTASWWSVLKHVVRVVRVAFGRCWETSRRWVTHAGTRAVDGAPQSARPMSLMLVVTWLTRAGAETQVKDLACEHARRGARVMVVSLREPEAFVPELTGAGVQVISLGMPKGVADPRGIVRLARAVRTFHPDVVHSHMVHANLLSRVARLFCHMPVLVCTAHNVDEGGRWRERLYRLTDRLADVTTNVSRAGVERYIRVRAAPAGRIRWVPNGIDVSRFERSPATRDAARTALHRTDAFVFLAVGRLERAKGFDVLLQALSLMHVQDGSVAVLIAGDGSQRIKLEAQASSLGLGAGIVRFLGMRDDVPTLMEAADALVLPSRWEGLPMVLLEAASAGLPAVATDVGDNGEVVVNQETGFLVPPDDHEALGRAMIRMASLSAEETREMAKRARLLVHEQYALGAVVDTWLDLYATCARRGDE
jgi:glycosyltransferase involved in cell wall biosynthesis